MALLPSPPAKPVARRDAPDPDLPQQIGKYRVRGRLGEGATSEVFLAHDDFRQMDVAIKRMRTWAPLPDTPASDFSNRFFSAEAALAARRGPILPLIGGMPDAGHALLERHVCIDTTASGGNAQLLAEVSGS